VKDKQLQFSQLTSGFNFQNVISKSLHHLPYIFTGGWEG